MVSLKRRLLIVPVCSGLLGEIVFSCSGWCMVEIGLLMAVWDRRNGWEGGGTGVGWRNQR